MTGMTTGDLRSVLPSAFILGVLLLVAALLTVTRGAGDPDPAARGRVAWLAASTLALQSIHFVEELWTGLHRRLPELLDLPSMSLTIFVSINLFWIVVWGLSIAGLPMRHHAALFPLWFLGLGTAFNGIAHPLLALSQGGSFPGLWTAPLTGVAGMFFLRRLTRLTRS